MGTVSHVDTSGKAYDKPVLMVGTKPFLFIGAQLRADTVRSNLGWSDADFLALMRQLNADGFTVVNIPLLWSQVEPPKDSFDWSVLNDHMRWCIEGGIRLEIVWFGSDSTGYSHGEAPGMQRVPTYALEEFDKVTRPDGSVLMTPTHRRVLLDKADPRLLAREAAVVHAMMNHVADWSRAHGAPDTVIGVQLLNEPFVALVRDGARTTERIDRSHSAPANALWREMGKPDAAQFRREVLLNYLHGLGAAVKSSRHVVWTRANFARHADAVPVLENEARRASKSGTALDFIGDDPYTYDCAVLRAYGSDPFWSAGRNFPMVMENFAGGGGGIDRTHIAALAGGAPINFYSVIESESPTDTTGYPGVYGVDAATLRAIDSPDTLLHRRLNRLLLKDWHSFATLRPFDAGGDRLAWFNVDGLPHASCEKQVGKTPIVYVTERGGTGIAISRGDNEYLLLSYGEGAFEFAASAELGSVSAGHHDARNVWIATETKTVIRRGGHIIVALDRDECVRVVLENAVCT